MYEFTNGIVVFDEKTRDRYIEAGYRLIEKKIETKSQEHPVEINEELNENTFNNGTIKRQSKKYNKLSK